MGRHEAMVLQPGDRVRVIGTKEVLVVTSSGELRKNTPEGTRLVVSISCIKDGEVINVLHNQIVKV